MADESKLNGWQTVVLELIRTLGTVALALVAVWQSSKAIDHATRNETAIHENRAELQRLKPMVYGAQAPKE